LNYARGANIRAQGFLDADARREIIA